MAFDILRKARSPLHVNEILSRIQASFKVPVDRESLVSSLTKKVARGDRFVRTGKNTLVCCRSHDDASAAWLAITTEWSGVFRRRRTVRRAQRQALGSLLCLGRRLCRALSGPRTRAEELVGRILPPFARRMEPARFV